MHVMPNAVSMRSRIAAAVRRFSADESGATAVEYSLLVGLIFLAIAAAVRNFTQSTSGMYDTIDQTLRDASS